MSSLDYESRLALACMKELVADRKSSAARQAEVRSLRQTDPEQLVLAQISEAESNFKQPLKDVFPYRIQPRDEVNYGKGASSVALNKLDYLPGDHGAIVELSIACKGEARLAACLTEAAIKWRLASPNPTMDRKLIGEFMQACDLQKAAKACTQHFKESRQLLTESSASFKNASLSGKTGRALNKYLHQVFMIEKQEAKKRKTFLELDTPPRRPKPVLKPEPKQKMPTVSQTARPTRVQKQYNPKPTNVFGKKTLGEKKRLQDAARKIAERWSREQSQM